MGNVKKIVLDDTNNIDIINYEKGLFIANSKGITKYPNFLEQTYMIDTKEKRLTPKLQNNEYFNIFVIKENDEIIAGVCSNLNMKDPLFLKFGFSGNYDNPENSEGFGLYSTKSFIHGFGYVAEELWNFARDYMINKGVIYNFGTAYGKRALNPYLSMGYEIVDSISYDKELYLIKYDLRKNLHQ